MKDSNFVLVQVKGKKTLLLSTVVHNMKYIVVGVSLSIYIFGGPFGKSYAFQLLFNKQK